MWSPEGHFPTRKLCLRIGIKTALCILAMKGTQAKPKLNLNIDILLFGIYNNDLHKKCLKEGDPEDRLTDGKIKSRVKVEDDRTMQMKG